MASGEGEGVPGEVLLIPGLYDSGAEHWQTHWQKEFGLARLEQADWETPRAEDWMAALDGAVSASASGLVLVAHSLGCVTVALWARRFPGLARKVKAAMLVAPSDTERPDFPAGATGFRPVPMERLPFRSMVVASTNDRYTSFERSQVFAGDWGSELVSIGDAGHITTVDGFGPWPRGLQLLHALHGDGGVGR